jgi:outer membrane protein assembly factor BamD (BamD/ComL family)
MPASRRLFGPLVCLLAVAVGAGCTSPGTKKGKKSFTEQVKDTLNTTLNSSYHDPYATDKMAEAEELFADEQYAEAHKRFGPIADNKYNPGQMVEKARFLEGECCRLQRKLPDAVATYNRYLKDHVGGVYSRQAADRMFAIAEEWRKDLMPDNSDGVKQASWVPNFTDPTRPRLDFNGELVKCYENIAEGAPHAECAEKAMFWAGYLHYAKGSYDDADHFFSTLAEHYPDSPLRADAVKYAIDAKNRAVGGPWYDGQKSNEALQLVHNIEASQPEYRRDPDKVEWLTKQKLGIREGQAERDFESAEYYRRTQKYGSAYFYYELVKRRYPGTRWSDLAAKRVDEMKAIQMKRDADKAAGKQSMLEQMQDGLDNLFNNKPRPEGVPIDPTEKRPTRPQPAPVVPLNGGYDGR